MAMNGQCSWKMISISLWKVCRTPWRPKVRPWYCEWPDEMLYAVLGLASEVIATR